MLLRFGGSMVTYGGMAKQPVTVPVVRWRSLFIFHSSTSLTALTEGVLSRVLSSSKTWRFGDFGSRSGRKIKRMVSHGGAAENTFEVFLRKFNETFSSDGRAFRNMLDELCNLIRQGKLTAPACTEVGLQDYSKALGIAMQPFTSAKHVLIMWTHTCEVSKLEYHLRGARCLT